MYSRHAGRALLTDAGRIYASEIAGAFGLIADATHLIAPQSQSGHLVIASSPSFAAKWLQPRLPDFLRANPGIKVRLSTLSGQDTLDRERCDIAIVYGHPPPGQARVEPLLAERLRPLCSPGLAAASRLRDPADLARTTLIHSSNALTWSDYLRRIGSAGLRPSHEIWLDRSTIAIDAAVAGLGVILESELLAEQELRDGRLIAPFSDPRLSIETQSYLLARPPGARNLRQAGRFETWLRAAIATGQQSEKTDRAPP